ncbi:MAG: HAD hydrolase-like protein [Thermoplasmata archaeon]|nr:HAD hydrolase-like protein [Thermoplasmata archaeon]
MRRGGRGLPVADLGRDAARRAGRLPRVDRWIRAIETLALAQSFEEVPGAREQLELVRDSGFRTAVVSNLVGETGTSMRRIMERLGMARFIDSWALSEELPWAKPAPEIFWHALDPLRVAASQAVHIGDLSSDVQGARAAGFRCGVRFVGARDYGTRYRALCRTEDPIVPPPDRILHGWADLPELLRTLFADEPHR